MTFPFNKIYLVNVFLDMAFAAGTVINIHELTKASQYEIAGKNRKMMYMSFQH